MGMRTEVVGGDYRFTFFNDSTGAVTRQLDLKLVTRNEPGGEHLIRVVIVEGGVEKATPIRFKPASGERVAADFQGCDPAYVIVDGAGHITNG